VSVQQPGDYGDGLAALIGLERISSDADRTVARVPVTDDLRQPFGVVHGGVYPVIAESICSLATLEAVRDEGLVPLGQANQATFMRPIFEGHIHAEATVRHRGRTTWIWDCELSDDEGRPCALVRMTIAVRPKPQ
jgi:1,4-dihydroxy-2-naphthoyl-CoA hydrolase